TNILDNATAVWVTDGDYAGKVYGLDPASKVVVDDVTLGSHTLVEVALPPVQVRAATTGPITLASTITTIDGVSLSGNGAAGSDPVLVKDQGSAEAGIYYANTGGAMTNARSPEPLTPNRTVRVSEGTVNAHGHHKIVTQGVVKLGTTAPV